MGMKRVIKVALLLFLLVGLYFILNSLLMKGNRTTQTASILLDVSKQTNSLSSGTKQGKITIVNMDAESLSPLENTEYILMDNEKNVIDVLITDVQGRVTTNLLDYGTSYTLKQSKIKEPYKLDTLEVHLEISESYQEVIFKNEIK